MSSRKPSQYFHPHQDLVGENSILNKVKIADVAKPPPYLMRIFKGYVKDEVENSTDIASIDFESFGKRWLPLFNYGAHTDHSGIPIMDWVKEVSGSPYKEVNLVRDGYIIAKIPPIFDRMQTVIREEDRDYWPTLAATLAVRHVQGGDLKGAEGYINRNMTDRIEINRALSQNFFKMNEIFELYGVKREIPDWIKELEGYKQDVTTKSNNAVTSNTNAVSFTSGMMEED